MRKLRDYQDAASAAVDAQLEQVDATMVVLPTGTGKCLARGTPILMYDGTIKAVEAVEIGDLLMGPDSAPRCVLSLSSGREMLYRVTPTKGDPYVVNESHILSLKLTPTRTGAGHEVVNLSVRDYLSRNSTFRHRAKGYRVAVNWPSATVPVDPYYLGLWLGDGTIRSTVVTKPDAEVAAAVASVAEDWGLRFVTYRQEGKCDSHAAVGSKGRGNNPLRDELRNLGVMNAKHVPPVYKCNNRAVRLAVLAGLLDSDGCVTCGGFDYISVDRQLSEDVAFLARSVGLAAYVSPSNKKSQNGTWGLYHRVSISGDCDLIPTRIPRKQAPPRRQIKDVLVTGISVEPVGEGDYFGFEIDGDRLFLLGDFTVTHNTVLMSDISRRWSERGSVLLLAHRVELLDQAAERLAPDLGYIPQVIQAQRKVDWNLVSGGQRVLVGSVQTLCREKRLQSLSRCPVPWSLLLIDECHHAVAKTYRRVWDSLREMHPRCKCLGVTATPKRTDKKATGLVFDSVAYQMEIAQAIELGWLVHPREERIIIEGVKFEQIPLKFNESGEPDFDPIALESLMTEEGPLQAVARPLIERTTNNKCLVFTAGVAHSHLLAAVINRLTGQEIAVAIDGKNNPPGDPRRKQAVSDLRSGKIRYLVNWGIFTEGTDIPECDVVCVARPTKSLTVLIQMIGRALRPLGGVVDGINTPELRIGAIAASAKPDARIIYFIPDAVNIRTVTIYDALGGNYHDDETKTLAARVAKEAPGSGALDDLKKAKAMAVLLAEEDLRKKIKAQVKYRVETVGEYDAPAAGENLSNIGRGGASDGQIKMLTSLGVTYETAAGYTSKQASVVIGKLMDERCTTKQRSTLIKFGENPDVNYHQARAIIDEIASNGWKPRKESA